MPARISAKLARAAVALALGASLPAVRGAAPARAAAVFVEVNPSTVEAGNQVGIRASCPNNSVAATVRSDAFGEVTVKPQYGFLVVAIRVPASRPTRTYTVRLICPDGSEATTNLHVVGRTRPTRGPATGFGGTAGDGSGGLLLGGGLVALAVGVTLGLLTLRRRRTA
jgi:hypothetical protein